MLKAGAPMLQALESARLSVGNQYLRGRFAQAIEEVRGGARLSATLRDIEFFPPRRPKWSLSARKPDRPRPCCCASPPMFERETQTAIERVMGLLTPSVDRDHRSVVGGLILTVMDAVLGINDLAMK